MGIGRKKEIESNNVRQSHEEDAGGKTQWRSSWVCCDSGTGHVLYSPSTLKLLSVSTPQRVK